MGPALEMGEDTMSITGRLFGFALLGPIGAVGPTEASKRAKAQKRLLVEQNQLLAGMANAARPVGANSPEEWRVGDRVESLVEQRVPKSGTVYIGWEGTVIDAERQNERDVPVVRVAWDRLGEPSWIRPDSIDLVTQASLELPPPPVVSEG